ncbi:MAG: creatininase [Rhodobacteraceae bacterium]|nr:creatininase [Paracoccaceae bacterium]
METVRIDEMTWVELEAKAKALHGPPIVILPTGALEQHGPHLPLGTDAMMPRFLAERIAPEIGGLVAPTLSYGFKSQPKSGGGNHFPGCVSLDASTYIALVKDVICDLARHGLSRITLFDGHMENQWFLTEAADLALRALKAEGVADVKIVKLGYWTYLTKATEDVLFPEGLLSWELEHAAVMETSVMLHLAPELVRQDLIPDGPPAAFPLYDVYPVDTRPIPETGVLSSAKSASAEKGRAVVAQVVPDIAAALREAFELGEA